jgi:predicted RNA polymerase sigma factor
MCCSGKRRLVWLFGALYEELVRHTDSAIVELNRAIAVAEVEGPETGLALVDQRRFLQRRVAEVSA